MPFPPCPQKSEGGTNTWLTLCLSFVRNTDDLQTGKWFWQTILKDSCWALDIIGAPLPSHMEYYKAFMTQKSCCSIHRVAW